MTLNERMRPLGGWKNKSNGWKNKDTTSLRVDRSKTSTVNSQNRSIGEQKALFRKFHRKPRQLRPFSSHLSRGKRYGFLQLSLILLQSLTQRIKWIILKVKTTGS